MAQRQGRVFTRLKQYEALPADQKSEIEALEQHLTSIKTQIFEKHHPKLIKSAVGVKYKELLEKIDAHLLHNGGQRVANDTSSEISKDAATHGTHEPTMKDKAMHAADKVTPGHSTSHGTHGTHGSSTMTGTEHGIPGTRTGYLEHGTRDVGGTTEPTMKDKTMHAADHVMPGHSTTRGGDHTSHGAHGTAQQHTDSYQEHATRGFGGAGATHEPTTKDKAMYAADKVTPGHSTTDTIGRTPTALGDGHVHGTQGIAGSPAPAILPTHGNATPHDKLVHAQEGVKAKVAGRTGDLHTTGRAKRLVEGLVLKGFITPYKEENVLNMNMRESFDFKDSDLFVPVAADLTELTEPTTTVWDVVEGAIYANSLKRKANIIEKIKYGKDVYAVVDTHSKTFTLFDDDVSQKCIVQFKAAGTQMAEDITSFDHGVKVWNDGDSEIFDPSTKPERDLLVSALREIGIKGMDGVGVVGHGATGAGIAAKGIHNATDKLKHNDRHGDTKDHHDHDVTDKLKGDRHHITDNQHTHGVGAATGVGAMQHGHDQRKHNLSTGTGAAHGDPASRISQEPTMKDKTAHAVDKVTPGHSTTHNENVVGDRHHTTTNNKHDHGLGAAAGVGAMKHDHRHSSADNQRTHDYSTGAAHGNPTDRIGQEPTMKDKAAHAADKVAHGHSTTDNQNVVGQGQNVMHSYDQRTGPTGHSAGVGAAHGNPTHRVGEEPTMKDKAAHAVDNVTPGTSTSTHGIHGSTTHGDSNLLNKGGDSLYNQRAGHTASENQREHGQGMTGSNTMKTNDPTLQQHSYSAGADQNNATASRVAAHEPTMMDKAASAMGSVKDYFVGSSANTTTDNQNIHGQGATGVNNQSNISSAFGETTKTDGTAARRDNVIAP